MQKSLFRLVPLWLGLGLALHAALRTDPAPAWFESSYERVLGTSLELKLAAPTAADAAVAEKAALAEIDRLAAVLSGYDAKSEFSRWMATHDKPVPVSDDLFQLLALFDLWRERTGGALDAAAETAGRLWQEAALRGREPSAAELQQAVAAMRQQHWQLDATRHTAVHLSGAPLRLNSFAKSYIIDHACTAALQTGRATSVVVNIGGDLVIRGAAAEDIGIARPDAAAENDAPFARLTLRDRAIATSGDYRRGYTVAGKTYSHLIDPRTGRPAAGVRSATVVSRSATEAGALATALCVLRPEEGAALASATPGVDYLMVLADGSQRTSASWMKLAGDGTAPFATDVASPSARTGAGGAAPLAAESSGVDLVVNLEIASPEGRRAKRPFVAVWIEDENHFPVRTIALWFKGARWLPDLRAWSRAEQLRRSTEGARNPQSIASATRGAGQYAVRWDGKDDSGHALPPGRYSVHIEAAREHGTHQLASGEIDTALPQQHVDLPGNVELASISLELTHGATR